MYLEEQLNFYFVRHTSSIPAIKYVSNRSLEDHMLWGSPNSRHHHYAYRKTAANGGGQ